MQLSKKWGKDKAGTTGKVKELRKSVHGDPMYAVTIGKQYRIFPETVLQLPKKKLTKKELEEVNPEPKAIKPKSIAVTTAVKDVLGLGKYNHKEVSPLKANLVYNLFKNADLDQVEILAENPSDYALGVLKKDGPFHSTWPSDEIELTDLGRDFIKAVNNRLESLRNQKHNYALFDGLNGYVPDNINYNDAIEFSKNNLEGKSIYHRDIGKKILFTKPGIKKAIHGKGKISRTRLQLIYLAKDLLKKSRLYSTEKDNKNRSNVGAIYKLRASTILDGQPFEIFITVQERENGSIYYDHTGLKIKRQNSVPGNVSTPLSRAKLPFKANKNTKTEPNGKKSGLKSPTIETEPKTTAGL